MTRVHLIYVIIALIPSASVNGKPKELLKGSTDLLEKENSRLTSKGIQCNVKPLDLQQLDKLRVSQHERALACFIKYLMDDSVSGWAWSGLASLYQSLGQSSAAQTSFKQAAKLDGPVSSFPRGWSFLGPFVVGKSELDGDPVAVYGGIHNISHTRFTKSFRLQSELGSGGEVGWTSYSAVSKNEYVRINLDGIDFRDLINSLGSIGITEWQGWIVGEFAINNDAKDRSAVMRCLGVHTAYVNGMPVVGDVYQREQHRFAVAAKRGIYEVTLRARAKGQLMFSCGIEILSESFEVLQPSYLPDIYDGRLFTGLFSLPISNLAFEKRLKITKITIEELPDSDTTQLRVSMVEKIFYVAPGQTRLIACRLTSGSDIVAQSCTGINLKLKISTSEGHAFISITLECRKLTDSFRFTFLDHDGSVQHGAAVRPLEDCPKDGCPILLTLHGMTGMTMVARNQADSYKRMINNQYVFGVEKAWVVAPTRHGAHNWEGPGAFTAMTAQKQFAQLTYDHSWILRKASADLVIIAGHSMGGHGAWHLATHFPDTALAVIPLAGWIKKEEYGDSNLFFRHDIATSHLEPSIKVILEKCFSENDADRHISNLKGMPVLMRVGTIDRTVHPFFSRRMYRLLKDWKINITYVEVPGKEHWWWDTKNDGGCVNDDFMRDFTNKQAAAAPVRTILPQSSQCTNDGVDCNADKLSAVKKESMYRSDVPVTDSFTYVVVNPAFQGSMRGIRVVIQRVPLLTSTVEVEVSEASVVVKTNNVQVLELQKSKLRIIDWSSMAIMIDGEVIDLIGELSQSGIDDQLVHCLCKDISWTLCDVCHDPELHGLRGPATLGPARRIAESSFLIATGSLVANKVKELEGLAVYIANQFLLTSDTSVAILQDQELTPELAAEHNLIIIGTPSENSLTQQFLERTPVRIVNGSISLNRCHYDSRRSGALVLAPHAQSRLALVLLGTSMDGLRDIISLATPTIPPMTRSPFSNMVPDFVITSSEFAKRGPGGYHCTGFWGTRWELRPELISCPQCCS